MERNSDYQAAIKRHAPSSPILKNTVKAFFFGGIICAIGELTANILSNFTEKENAYLSVTVIFIILSSSLTALGVFDRIARHAGAGTLVPVTGFANSVTSAAIDARSEGFIAGVGTKIFTVAGPVILYSTLAGTLYGLIYYIYLLFA